jgi:hypothetical protein
MVPQNSENHSAASGEAPIIGEELPKKPDELIINV